MKLKLKLKMKPTFSFPLFFSLIFSVPLFAKQVEVRKVQEVNFDELSLKGTVRNPEGAYLVQKEGIQFMPLYEVKKDLDQKIRSSVDLRQK